MPSQGSARSVRLTARRSRTPTGGSRPWTSSAGSGRGSRPPFPTCRRGAPRHRRGRGPAGPLPRPLAAHPARGDHRPRGRARAGRAGRRPAAVGHPAALRHLGADPLRRPAHRAWAWCSPARPATPGPALFGLGRGRAAGRRARRRPALGAARRCSRCCSCRSATGTASGRCWSPARVVFAATWWLPPEGQAAFAALATWFLLLAAPRTVLELQAARRRRRAPDSDADQLARLTRAARRCSGSASSCSSTSARWLLGGALAAQLTAPARGCSSGCAGRGSQPTGWRTGSTCGAGGMSSTRSVWSTVTWRPWWRMSSGSPSSSR